MGFRGPQFKRCLVPQDGINDVGNLVHDSADRHIGRFALAFLLIELCQNRVANRAETIRVDRIMGNHVQHSPDIRRTALRKLIPSTLYCPGLPLRWIKAKICGQLLRFAE